MFEVWWKVTEEMTLRNFVFLLLISISTFSHSTCNDGFKRCVSECNGIKSIFNYENSSYVKTSETDFPVKCEDSCRRGKRYCEDESNLSDGCDEFKRKCRNECPSSVFSYRTGNFLMVTDANNKCEDSCTSGYRRCE